MKVFIDIDEAETTFPEPQKMSIPSDIHTVSLQGEGTLKNAELRLLSRFSKNMLNGQNIRRRQIMRIIKRYRKLWDGTITERNIWFYVHGAAMIFGWVHLGKRVSPDLVEMAEQIWKYLVPFYTGENYRAYEEAERRRHVGEICGGI